MADFSALCDAAHKLGIKVILDGVYSHTGSDSLYFDKNRNFGGNGAYNSKESPYYDWYTFKQWPDRYNAWWDFDTLPTVKKMESSFIEYIITGKDSVLEHWLKAGADGFRLDVADELPNEFMDILKKHLRKLKPDALLIGEVWEDASNKIAYNQRKAYFRGKQLDSVTNYPVKNAIVDFIKYGDARSFAETVDTLYRHYPPRKLAGLFNYLGSHDTERIATVLGGIPEHELEYKQLATTFMPSEVREQTKELLKQAYLLLASLPGVPCIFYGDEIAMEGYRDPFNRRTFPESGFDDEMSRFFAKVNNIRRKEPLFTAERLIVTHNENGVVKLARVMGDKSLLVFANMSNEAYEAVHVGGKAVDLINGTEYTDKVTIPAKKVIILKTEK
jgi:glycosidase